MYISEERQSHERKSPGPEELRRGERAAALLPLPIVPTMGPRSVSIVGCGYTGLRLAQRWRSLSCSVRGFATREQSLRQIAAAGIEAAFLDLDRPQGTLNFAGQLLYYLVPPAEDGDRDLRLERFFEHMEGAVVRFVYLSTTGVYGNREGAWVDEDTPPAPQSRRAVRRLAAENALRAWADARGVSWCILRVPGIYGPGRLPIERLRRSEPAIDPREAAPGNRIQVEDLTTACLAAGCTKNADRRIYNITDGTDDSLTSFLQRVARIGNLPLPPLIGSAEAHARLAGTTREFLGESRRVDNRRMREELGVEPAYHDLDAGIRASL
jgi:nucleoside-diphosphate-sugar epimerase